MLDPLTALSVASSIVQFVDFGWGLLATSREVFESADGTSIGNAELEIIAKDIQELNEQPDREREPLMKSEIALQKLGANSSVVAGELICALECLKLQGAKGRRWKSLRQAVKSVWKKEWIDGIVMRLESFRDELNVHILINLREDLDLKFVKQLEGYTKLDKATQALAENIQTSQELILKALDDSASLVILGQDRAEQLIVAESERTRTLIASIQEAEKESRLSLDVAAPSDISQALKEKQEEEQKNELISFLLLASLRFPTMMDRVTEIAPAHRETYTWIFKTPESDCCHWTHFPGWLKCGSGMYWINGKPASGKSTLMRYIVDSPQTQLLLQGWFPFRNNMNSHVPGNSLNHVNSSLSNSRAQEDLIIVSHFFWNSGVPQQRSYSGLLRALLYQILQQRTDLVPRVFPSQFSEQKKFTLTVIQNSAPESWTLPKLSQAFELLFAVIDSSTRFCLFIDGLDEYDGDYLDIIDLFLRVSRHPNVKLCVSSRPIHDFVKFFKGLPGLRLQDLTAKDIKKYVDDELGENPQMKILQLREPLTAPTLVLEIVDCADGVFLWVRLVVLSLLRGLRNNDEISDLQRRLRLLPKSLEELFSHILGRLELVYLEQSSRIFNIFAATRKAEFPFTSLELYFAESDISMKFCNRIPTRDELVAKCELAESWLLTRCGGLIEPHFHASAPGIINHRLSYLHRTARDFLELPGVQSGLLKPADSEHFVPARALVKSCVLYLKWVLYPNHSIQVQNAFKGITRSDCAKRGLHYAFQLKGVADKTALLVQEELNRIALDPPTYHPFELLCLRSI